MQIWVFSCLLKFLFFKVIRLFLKLNIFMPEINNRLLFQLVGKDGS